MIVYIDYVRCRLYTAIKHDNKNKRLIIESISNIQYALHKYTMKRVFIPLFNNFPVQACQTRGYPRDYIIICLPHC